MTKKNRRRLLVAETAQLSAVPSPPALPREASSSVGPSPILQDVYQGGCCRTITGCDLEFPRKKITFSFGMSCQGFGVRGLCWGWGLGVVSTWAFEVSPPLLRSAVLLLEPPLPPDEPNLTESVRLKMQFA